jgi:hypothetical protein
MISMVRRNEVRVKSSISFDDMSRDVPSPASEMIVRPAGAALP